MHLFRLLDALQVIVNTAFRRQLQDVAGELLLEPQRILPIKRYHCNALTTHHRPAGRYQALAPSHLAAKITILIAFGIVPRWMTER